jgi:hypothetical protein
MVLLGGLLVVLFDPPAGLVAGHHLGRPLGDGRPDGGRWTLSLVRTLFRVRTGAFTFNPRGSSPGVGPSSPVVRHRRVGLDSPAHLGPGSGCARGTLVTAPAPYGPRRLIGFGAYRPFEAGGSGAGWRGLATVAAVLLLLWQPVIRAGWPVGGAGRPGHWPGGFHLPSGEVVPSRPPGRKDGAWRGGQNHRSPRAPVPA